MSVARRRIAIVTGTRAEYGLLQSTLKAMDRAPQLEPQLIVAGMHLLRRFGSTVRQIERDGWAIAARVSMQKGDGTSLDQARGLGRGVSGIAAALERLGPERVLVLGDRIEAMAGALAAVATGRFLAHIHGGDVAPGDFDDRLRNAITQMSALHLTATRQAAQRVRRMGADPKTVHVVGAPGLDRIRELLTAVGHEREEEHRDEPPNALVVQHAYGRADATERAVAKRVLDAVARAGLRRVIVFPNSDRGNAGVIDAIEQHQRRHDRRDVRVCRSMPRDDYLRALIAARVLIGNSSSGIIEAPFAGTAAVNVGARQHARQLGGPSIVHSAESSHAIHGALQQALRMRPRAGRVGVYGAGDSGDRIVRCLTKW